MNTLIHHTTGLIHLFSAVAALLLGSFVLFMKKGTLLHKRMGYLYVFSMIVMNITAFCIYELFHRFGPFHIAALISSVTLLMGFLPALFKKQIPSWIYYHVFGMYYSAIGLYAAFAAEVIVRIPGIHFGIGVSVATLVVMGAGILIIQINKKNWLPKTQSN
jgi:hypothetical protein